MFDVSEALARLGVDELRRRQEEATRLLDQEGVVHRDYGATVPLARLASRGYSEHEPNST